MPAPNMVREPLLARFAIRRDAGDELPGHYDHEQAMWVIDTEGGQRPLVEVATSILALETITKVLNEQADTASSLGLDAEMGKRASILATLLTGTITEAPESDDLHDPAG